MIWIFAAAIIDDASRVVPHIAPYYPAVCANPTADEGVRVPGKYDDAGRVVSRALRCPSSMDYINFLYKVRRETCSEIIWCSSSIGTRSCFIVSRKRTVTQLSTKVSWSTVMQNGVPMAS